ncbi:MAG: single-stranded-DNA-specific exonuclease RecJ [Polyangiaceae bacterium]
MQHFAVEKRGMVMQAPELSALALASERCLEPRRGANEQIQNLAVALGISRTLADVFVRREILDAERVRRFLAPKLADLTIPDQMADRGALAERLVRAVRNRERIVVYGDYDCDGITSAAILTDILRSLGGHVVPHLASRFDGGYGVSLPAVQRILASKPSVLVTCDCGSSDHASLKVVSEAGVDVLVIDHHLVPDAPLPAKAFINPHRPECGFPYKGLASCGLALSIGAALRTELDPKLDLRRYLDLVAIGTIADVAPLDGDNRPLVRAGLDMLRRAERPGVKALLEYAKIDLNAPISGEDVAFRVAPRINAPGRLGAPDPAFDLLLAKNLDTARSLAARVEQITDQRKELQREMEQASIELIEEAGWDKEPAIVVGEESWNHGIVGIVAGRLTDRYNVPVIVVGFEGQLGRGSVRGPAGSRLYDALSKASAHLDRFGGHQAAAGVTLQRENLEQFREDFLAACAEGTASPRGEVRQDPAQVVRLDPSDDPFQVVRDFERLEPCGEANPAPKLRIEAKLVSAREVTGGHLKLELQLPSGRRIGAFGVEQGAQATQLGEQVVAVGRHKRDTYRGGEAVEMRLDQVRG